VPLANRYAIRREVLAGFTCLLRTPVGPLGAVIPSTLLRRGFGHQELLAVARLQRERRGDIGHRHVVLALVVLDHAAEQLDSRRVERVGDRVAELRDPLGVDVLDRRQLRLDQL
jgi:hypothetical protein